MHAQEVFTMKMLTVIFVKRQTMVRIALTLALLRINFNGGLMLMGGVNMLS